MTGEDLSAVEQLALVERERQRRRAEEDLLAMVVTFAVRRAVDEDLGAVEAVDRASADLETGEFAVPVPVDVRGEAEGVVDDALEDVRARLEERGRP